MILVVGDVLVDVVARHDAAALAHGSDTPARVSLHGGGAAGNVAAWLGDRARLVARVGADPLAAVALEGIAGGCEVDPLRATGVCVVLVGPDGERTMLPDPGASAALPEPGPMAAEAVYVSGYALLRESTRATALAWVEAARAAGVPTAVDPASAAPLGEALGVFERLRCDLVLANADEAAVLGPDRLRAIASEVVVKRGPGGAEWSDGARTLHIPAAPADVVDTTGAGDAFAAGFLSAWADGPQAALRAGAALAARAIAVPGARRPSRSFRSAQAP